MEEKQEDQTKSIENNVETKKNQSCNELTFEEGKLTKEDVDSLNDGKCLTDATISFAFAQFEKEMKKELEENNIQLVRPEVAMVLKRGDKSQVQETKRAMKQNGKKIFMTPVNDSTNLDKWGSGNHYSVLFTDTTSKIFMHLDSIEGKNTAHAKEMALSMLDEDSFDEKGKLEWTFTEDTTCGKQNNGFDCGVYVIHNVKAAIENICHAEKFEGNSPTTEEITRLRRELKHQVHTEIKRQSQEKEKMETAVNKINKQIESNNKSDSPTENKQNESSEGCSNCEKIRNQNEMIKEYLSEVENQKEKNDQGENGTGTPKEKNDQGENGKEKNISGNNVDSNKGNIEDTNTNKKRFMNRKEKDCRYFWKGSCRKGDRCWYRHVKICVNWERRGNCPDSGCKLSHPDKCNKFYAGECNRNNCWYFHPRELKIIVKDIQHGTFRQQAGQYQEQSHGKNYRGRMNQNFQYQQGRRGNRRGNQVNNQQREWPYQHMNRSPQEMSHAMVAQQGENIPYCSCRDHHPRCYHGMQGAW